MTDELVKVVAYAGGRGEEQPRTFFLEDEKVEVAEVVGAWIEEEAKSRVRRRFFEVKTGDGRRHVIYHDEKLQAWFLHAKRRQTRRF